MRESVELALVGFHLSNKVYEVLGFSEFIEVFSINHVAKLVLNLDNEFDDIEAVQTVVFEAALKGNLSLLGCAEISTNDAKHVLLNLIVIF